MGKKTNPLALPSAVLSVGVIKRVLHDGPNGHPRLLGCGDNLCGWQQEAIVPRVTELEGEGVLDATVIGPVDSDPTGHIWIQKGKEMPPKGRTGCGHKVQRPPERTVGPGGQTPTHSRPHQASWPRPQPGPYAAHPAQSLPWQKESFWRPPDLGYLPSKNIAVTQALGDRH